MAAVIVIAITLLFAVTPLDLDAARIFYRPYAIDHWPLAQRPPWSLLYRAAPWITASLVLSGLVGLLLGARLHRPRWRLRAVFVLLAVLVGPGLLVNGLFKDHWDRPRPRDIVQFGGPLPYVAAPLRGPGGASFPCGHCSVGFLYALGWWIWRRRRPWIAAGSLALGIASGSALGLGRMAAGGHFLSDVVWSALLALGIAHLLYYYVLRIPAREAQTVATPAVAAVAAAPSSWAARAGAHQVLLTGLTVLVACGGVGVLLALFAFPHGTALSERIGLDSLPARPRTFEIVARRLDVRIDLVDTSTPTVSVVGELHGFGLPTGRLSAATQFVARPVPMLIFRVVQRGWFTDLNGTATFDIPAAAVQCVLVRVERGNISVTDATRAGVLRTGRVRLDLRTGAGVVRQHTATPAPAAASAATAAPAAAIAAAAATAAVDRTGLPHAPTAVRLASSSPPVSAPANCAL
ncbi:MAG TPA: phosphatase PAP2 family protein [Steroidobacteraceae bacterium]|nr:phosphatase PAP2 family protein [Steroidobacteraceae bacterium]